MLQEYSREVFVSYAWGGASEKLVDLLEQALKEEGINIVRDKRNLPYKGIIKEFMERLGRSQCIVVVISDKYLKSKNCMFELMEVSRNGQLHDRIFPIILPDARIYNANDVIEYIKYWEGKKNELNEQMRTVSLEKLQGIREEIDIYADVRSEFSEIIGIVRSMNNLTSDTHVESNFELVTKEIKQKISEATSKNFNLETNSDSNTDETGDVLDSLLETFSEEGGLFYDLHWITSESNEEQILKNELKRNKDISPKILGDGDFDRVVQIWLSIDSNNLFNPSHYYWQDKPFFKCIIQNVKYDLFVANFRLAQDNLSIDKSAAGLYANKAFEVIDQISLCSPYSIQGASSTRLRPEDAHFRNLDYKDMMKNTFTWLERWGIESLEGLYGIPKLKSEVLLHRVESRLQELDFLTHVPLIHFSRK